MTDVDLFTAYRKVYNSLDDGISFWWYFGTTTVEIPGEPTVFPVTQAETVMSYRTETVGPDEYKMHWLEIGSFRDLLTSELPKTWQNPVTGKTVTAPTNFDEGPSCFTIKRAGNGVEMSLVQAHANVIGVKSRHRVENGRCLLVQEERKHRGFPSADGTLPEPGQPGSTEALTVLSVYADVAALNDPTVKSVPSNGVYSLDLGVVPPWMGFKDNVGKLKVNGIMQKAAANEVLNKSAWDRLHAFYPDFFKGKDGGLGPDWGF